MTVVTSPDLTRPKPTEVIPVQGRVQVETPEGIQRQMIKNVVAPTKKIVPSFTVEQAHPQSADASLQKNPHMQAIGAVVKDENGFPFTPNDAVNALESIGQDIRGEPSRGRLVRGWEGFKTLRKRIFGKKNAGPTQVIEVGE